MSHSKSEFASDILSVRAVEDCVRITKKYTEGIKTIRAKHPIQGEEFPSNTLVKYYEVYPDVELSWDMPASQAWAWVWGDTRHIDVRFKYNYNINIAWLIVQDGETAVRELARAIPGFSEALAKVIVNGSSRTSKA